MRLTLLHVSVAVALLAAPTTLCAQRATTRVFDTRLQPHPAWPAPSNLVPPATCDRPRSEVIGNSIVIGALAGALGGAIISGLAFGTQPIWPFIAYGAVAGLIGGIIQARGCPE